MMRTPILCSALLSLASCGAVQKASDSIAATADEIRATVSEGRELIETVQVERDRIVAASDTDGDGETSVQEILLYFLGGGSLLGGGALARAQSKNETERARIETKVQALERKAET